MFYRFMSSSILYHKQIIITSKMKKKVRRDCSKISGFATAPLKKSVFFRDFRGSL